MSKGNKQRRFQANQAVGQWTLLEYVPGRYGDGERGKGKHCEVKPRWKCQCACGVIRLVQADNLASGSSKSCGHDHIGTRESHEPRNLPPINSVFALGAYA